MEDNNKGNFTRMEIASQPDVWRKILEGFFSQQGALASELAEPATGQFYITGCGSTYALSLSAAAIFRKMGIRATAYPASEIVFYPELLSPGPAQLLTISRSGTTTETLWAVDSFRKQQPGEKVTAITTMPESTLAKKVDFVLGAPEAQEQSVAQTRSFTSMLLLAQVMAGILAQDQTYLSHLRSLPEALSNLYVRYPHLANHIAADRSLKRFFFLGSGPLFGLAMEAMIKTKEITTSWAEAFNPMEFRHGPMSVVNEESLVVCFISDNAGEAEVQVLRDMKKFGARTMAFVEQTSLYNLSAVDVLVELNSGLNQWERGALYLPVIQWAAYYRAMLTGYNPDRPTHLTAVVELS